MQLFARTCNYERMNVERIFARLFVVAGGAFWTAAAFGASWAYQDAGIAEAVGTAFVPLAITVITFVVGWFYEQLAALLLAVGAAAATAWGLVAGWEAGLWLTMIAVLIAPMLIAALLFMLASRMQNICRLEETSATSR